MTDNDKRSAKNDSPGKHKNNHHKNRKKGHHERMMKFVAIDFETANSKLSSPCSLGMVVVEEGEIRSKHHWYIRPEPFYFNPMNIGIHGITPEMIEDAPTFDVLWPELEPFFKHYDALEDSIA